MVFFSWKKLHACGDSHAQTHLRVRFVRVIKVIQYKQEKCLLFRAYNMHFIASNFYGKGTVL